MSSQLPRCPVCGDTLNLSLAHGRKSGKPFIMFRCLIDGRHFRAFITYRPYVEEMINKLEILKQTIIGVTK
jgi:hypothetical protein